MFNSKLVTLILLVLLATSCKNILDIPPQGAVSEEDLNTPDGAEKLSMAAYASLGNDHWNEPYTSMWPYGNVRADDAYKGGLGAADIADYHQYEIFSTIRPDQGSGNRMWTRLYIGVQRANSALRNINKFDETTYPEKPQRIAEMKFLRAHFHFLLKLLFKNIPYLTEDIETEEIENVSNTQLTSNEIWNKIAEDFQSAIAVLPQNQDQIGRPNQFVAKAYLAKVRLYQAYEQDDNHNVTNINKELLEQVVQLTNDVINSGKYSLYDDYAKNYLWEYDNGMESLFAVQRSKDDGSPIGRIDMSNALNHPMLPGYGCCSFHRPSQNLVNAFQTTSEGTPLFNNFNKSSLESPGDFKTKFIDPRLDHTVGIPGHPYKYQQNILYNTETFTREPETYGPYSAMKEVQQLDCPCLTTAKTFAYPASSKNNDIIKLSDVLLWQAEALIELGRHNEALPLINQIRVRAKNSTNRLKYASGEFISNYKIEPYTQGVNIDWTQDNARIALRWERRLEFAMEGVRFFDLVRWGIAAETINEYFEVEKTRVPHLVVAKFTKGRDEYLPIPEQQIQFSNGLYSQNKGWN